jgi:hypothetical protein
MLSHKLIFCLIIFTFTTVSLSQAAFGQTAPESRSFQDFLLSYLIGLGGGASGGGTLLAGQKVKGDRDNARKALSQALRALWSMLPDTEQFTLSKQLNRQEIENLWKKLQDYNYSENLSVLENSEDLAIKDVASDFLKIYSDVKNYLSEPDKMEKEFPNIVREIKEYHIRMDKRRKEFMAETIKMRTR